jgi:hypothetical protein
MGGSVFRTYDQLMLKDIPEFTGSKAVVTGSAGFVPSHLIDRLLADGLRVVAFDKGIREPIDCFRGVV